MKKYSVRLAFIAFVSSLMVSCSFYTGQVVSLDYGKPLNETERAVGSEKSVYVFGIGGNRDTQLMHRLKDDLVRQRPLLVGEKYVNVNYTRTIRFWGFWFVIQHELTADVVGGTPRTDLIEINQDFNKLSTCLAVGDSIYDKRLKYIGVATNFLEEGVTVYNEKYKNELKTVIPWNDLFVTRGSYKNIKIGQTLKHVGILKEKQVVKALGVTKLVVENKYHEEELIDYIKQE